VPTYDYQCAKCGKRFEAQQTVAEHDRRQATCPECRSHSVSQLPSAFHAVTSKKS
jgi:putative FmdB family regulatory protein